MAAFEAIISRQSWYADAAIAAYWAVQFGTDGKLEKADGTRPFAGIVQYGSSAADEMITVVKGAYPVISTEAVTVGALLTIDSGTPGKFRIADTAADKVYGVALTAAVNIGDTFTLSMIEVPVVIPGQ